MTLEDVAKRAGVSTATVSRVINNSTNVRPATRARVLKAIRELNYTPNIHARVLAAGSSRALALIVSNIENPFFVDIFRYLENEALASGYEVMIASTNYEPERLRTLVRLMLGRQISGMALMVSELEESLATELQRARARLVLLDAPGSYQDAVVVRLSYQREMQRLCEYLYSLGHRRMAFIGHHTTLGPLSQRLQAFLNVMEQYASEVSWRVVTDDDNFAGGRRAVRELFASGFNPTAVVCVNDCMAVGALSQLREMGLRVPDDVSVTGFDNIALAEVVHPPLTTVHIPRDVIGRTIFAHLVVRDDRSEDRPQEVFIEPQLILRDSTGPAPSRVRKVS